MPQHRNVVSSHSKEPQQVEFYASKGSEPSKEAKSILSPCLSPDRAAALVIRADDATRIGQPLQGNMSTFGSPGALPTTRPTP